jgi:RNA polymerase sigma-70 factor (ECF subfamily)
MDSDEALMIEFQRGSRAALEELFARYRDPLFGFFRRRVESRGRAEDLTQEVFVAVMRAQARYEPRATVRTYLFGIALKMAWAERRKPFEAAAEVEPARAASPDEGMWVRQALAKLDAQEREVLMLREYEQLSYAEIAGLLRIPLNTVRTRLFRSRTALKALLDPKEAAGA